MIEYPGSQFSEPMDMAEAFKKFQDHIEVGTPVKALHIGSIEELKRKRMMPDFEMRLEALEEKIKTLEPAPESKIIHIPTEEEFRMFVREDSPCRVSV